MENKVADTAKETRYPITKEKKVWLLRRHRKSILPESGLLISSAEDYHCYIGSAFVSRRDKRHLGRSLFTEQEEHKLMPKLVGVSATHAEWDSKLDEYWHNLLVSVPYEGLLLDVSTIHTMADDRKGTPRNYFDYVLHEYCLKYGEVANSIDDVSKSARIRAYLWNKEEQTKRENNVLQIKDEAIIKRLQIQKDTAAVKDVLLLGNKPSNGSESELKLALAKFSEEEPSRFLEITRDTNIAEKAQIERYIRVGFMLRLIGTTVITYDNVSIANDLDRTVVWLNLPENAIIKETLRARYNQL